MAIWDWDFDVGNWNPWLEFARMRRRLDRLLGGSIEPTALSVFPLVNIWSDNEKALVTTELEGINPKDLDVSVKGDLLTLRGSREPEQLGEGERYLRYERGHGAFSRSISLPFPVEADKVGAKYTNGILKLTLPRSGESKPKKVEIKS